MTTTKPSARERLLVAADELFYAEGIQTVGIDRVIERAGVAKASLYNAFGGKDDLVHDYLHARQVRLIDRLRAAAARHRSPRARILAVFAEQASYAGSPRYHGCAFARASAEAPADSRVADAVRDYRAAIHDLFRELAEDLGARDPDLLSRQLQLLYDGFHMASYMHDRYEGRDRAVRRAAESLLDSAVG
jgi:AcrR family transcriptional regulator